MVFAKLGTNEKQAFFDLLDEYFSSRPELLANLGAPSSQPQEEAPGNLPFNKRAAASAVHGALAANPEATASLISAGLRHGAQNSSSVKNSPFAQAAANPEIANSLGRVAAASIAFQSGPKKSAPPPPSLPRRVPSSTLSRDEERESSPSPQPPSRAPAPKKALGAPGLVQGRSFGDVRTDSFKAAFSSVRNGTANKQKPPPSVAPPIPSAFPKHANNFPPPPVRRATNDASESPARNTSPEPEETEDVEEEGGEWAEALYDYNSGEAGDLSLRAHQRVRIVSEDSDDWWTGEVDGRTGLFPASYVKKT